MTLSYSHHVSLSDWLEPETSLDWGVPRQRSLGTEKLRIIEEAVLKALAAPNETPLGERFREHASRWVRETRYISSPTQRIMHPSYQAILGMGKDVVPYMLRDLVQNRAEWFWALSYITHENPIRREDAGKTDAMIGAWEQWGKERGLL